MKYVSTDNHIQNHLSALIEYSRGNLNNAKDILETSYRKDRYNIYIASLMSDIVWAQGNKENARKILQDVLEIYPNNNAISFQLLKQNIKDSVDLERSVKKLDAIMLNNRNNPIAYKLLAEGYEKIQEKYKAKLALINFYHLKGNLPMAFRVIDDGLGSNQFNEYQKSFLSSIRLRILCDGNPPLEPIFGEKTCD